MAPAVFTIPQSYEEVSPTASASGSGTVSGGTTSGLSFTLRSQARIATLRRLTKAAMSFLICALEDKALLYTMELALYEACSNVVRHAYDTAHRGEMLVTLELCPLHHVTFEITDWGRGFASYPVKLRKPLPEDEDGRGLLIIRGLADHLSIRNKGEATILRMHFGIEENKWRICALQDEETGWL